MMLRKPTLIVKRLLAKVGGKTVYDEKFHNGLNVLSGCNGGGKTSIVQLLTYGLGYEVANWKVEASQCDTVYLEVSINGESVTLKRKNDGSLKQSTDICFKTLEEALNSGPEEWRNYPYSINTSRESFSQKMFALMGIPEAKADINNNNITMHLILRLLYSDQSNVSGSIFNIESFDSAFKRESIGNYLLGLYDDDIYNTRILLSQADKNLDKSIANLNAVNAVVGKTSYAKQFNTIDEARKSNIDLIDNAKKEITEIKEKAYLQYSKEKKITESFATESIKTKTALLKCEEKIQIIHYDVEDSNNFLLELYDKSNSINDSIRVGALVKSINFDFCPSCFTEVKDHSDFFCNLCGTEKPVSQKDTNLLRMKNEVDIQIKESKKILENKQRKLQELKEERKELTSKLRSHINKVTSSIPSLNSSDETLIYEQYRKIGEAEEQLKNLDKIEELYKSMSQLRAERDKYQQEVNELKGRIDLMSYQYQLRQQEIRKIISDHLITILRKDIGAENTFQNAENIEFDFASSRVSVNGRVSFSESGTVYLNNAFHFALFLASLEKEYIRIPRFMILDGIENGGMQDDRSKNFQKIIKEMIEQYHLPHQIIVATKSIYKELDNPNYIVGKTFTKENRSLKL